MFLSSVSRPYRSKWLISSLSSDSKTRATRAFSREARSAWFQVEQRPQRREHPKYDTKGYLFWVIDVAKYYTSRYCVRTRVLDISIAWMESVLGNIVGERVYRYGPGANTAHCVGRALSPTPSIPRSVERNTARVATPRPGSKLGKSKNDSGSARA